jgi:hypothetical protein
VDQEEMKRLGRNGYVHVGEKEAIVAAFEGVAERIKGMAARYYLLSYCSPSRAGMHELTVEAVVGEERGDLSYSFDAEGFEPGCDPQTPPAFDVPGTKGGARPGPRKAVKKPAAQPAQPTAGEDAPDGPPQAGY